mmetsp:Transcript_98010/g.174503  ORF Transcript_98010/g.174503 Transcript_98010/m.174503 type:complete len:541 (-) Transcript_98010:16-1638(-)|eukprot:CAMPEP_0197621880 /NCGR_PEP_ID=MMETSP1338-20131121/2309_1 /TAXON_ID=43686 ORGANISM="Pelagodinium beii, Strain RCC1491" /NCGR_SAMPLE_ID=MMETSP1338 /ASSEMBLY_ACC=CAM_ASM_000754 /LENGTH=540 /DNA_ID=CAMNT_0043191449 /DNA_START=73 /DNA_END=1695 /DNA_ORIENTATION=-
MRLTAGSMGRVLSGIHLQGVDSPLIVAVESEGQRQEAVVALICSFLALLVFLILAVVYRPQGKEAEDTAGRRDLVPEGEDFIPRKSALQIWAFSALNIPYGFTIAAVGLIVVPLEAERLWPESHSEALGILAVLAGMAQLVGPQAGHLSDTYRSSLGRRRPMLMMGVALNCSLTFGLWVLSVNSQRLAFALTFLLQQVAVTVVFSAQAGLVPDLIPAEQHDIAGGASAANILVGAVGACAYVRYAKALDYHMTYAVIASLTAFFCILVCGVAQEKSTIDTEIPNFSRSGPEAIFRLYSFDTQEHQDFFWLLVTKTLYCSSMVVKAFLLFFVQDLFRNLPNSSYEGMVAEMAAVAEVVAAVSALGLMVWLSRKNKSGDKATMTSKKQRSLVSLSGGAFWMALLWLSPVLIGAGANSQRNQKPSEKLVELWLPPMLLGLGMWGIGQGIYLASDQATALALLPDKAEASRLLALGSVCSFLGSVIGGSLAAFLLSFFGAMGKDSSGYAFPGYAAIFIYASLLNLGIAMIAYRIQIPKELPSLA